MEKINADQICEVRILDRRQHPHYVYMGAKKSFIWGNRKEGFYYTLVVGGPEFMTVQEIEADDSLVCLGSMVFYRPRIFIKMSNGDTKYKYFDTKSAAIEYFQNAPEFSGIKWVDHFAG